ncbi:putative metal-dependent hydrolase of the TIM-barrel fold protein [Anaerohalosphaera lusitana]|uniref:Putative metal-dependent hydrolase of the TIM-barrel fold protein n=1 Tax=Anaerohalosphaera lusitana TaxID=1936003 RepID=A0A1U9NNM5_9BACT|nr:amidohydrolase family protein [Anaerohalosphaera lusitana]AQT69328.1 putative metal-dependent hydrolase of the TIM-barrel fold protein [Anaerohalosphaera lusitana]
MITDCHTHIANPTNKAEIEGHLEACSSADACIVLGSVENSIPDYNKQLGEYCKSHKKMTGFGVINPVEDPVKSRAVKNRIRDAGLAGIVLYCSEHRFHPAHSRAMRLYEAAEKLNLPVFFHNSAPYSSGAIMDYGRTFLLDEIARRFPSLKIIIGGMGVPFASETICMISKHDNVFADLTFRPNRVWEVYNLVVTAYEADVMDKLLFGSGYPLSGVNECVETLLGFNRLMADTHLPVVPRQELRNIIERDAFALLGL